MLHNNSPAQRYRSIFVTAALSGSSSPAAAEDWYKTLLSVTEQSIRPYAAEVDKSACYPTEAVNALRGIGAFGLTVPETCHGLNYGDSIAALAVETVAAACPSTAAIMMFHYQVVRRTLHYGDLAWRENDLKKLASGEWLGSSAWTEFGAGADKSELATRLSRSGTEFFVNGAKHFCTGLEGCSVVHVLLDAGEHSNKAPTFIRIPTQNPGVAISEIYPLLGLRASSTGTIELRNVKIDPNDIIGAIGDGGMMMSENHAFFMNPGLIAMGVATAAFNEAHHSVLGESPGSRNITGFQSCRFRLTEMEEKLSQTYAMAAGATLRAARNESVHSSEFLKIKLTASEAAVAVASEALRLAGGRGFHTGWSFERHLRDAYATVLMGPANEVIKERIAEQLLKAPAEDEREVTSNNIQQQAERAS